MPVDRALRRCRRRARRAARTTRAACRAGRRGRCRGRRARRARARARPRAATREREVAPAAGARIGPARATQACAAPPRRARRAATGARRRLVGTQAAARELREDRLGRAGDVARRVEVFDAHQPAAAVGARVEPRGERGDQRAGVQRAGRRGREAADVGALDAVAPRAALARSGAPISARRRPPWRSSSAWRVVALSSCSSHQRSARPGCGLARAPSRRTGSAPGVAEARRRLRALHLLDDEAAGGDRARAPSARARSRSRASAAARRSWPACR